MRAVARLVAAVVLTAAASAAVPTAPASAAACSTSHGVTVVVDFHELGGGVQQACDADGADTSASTLFPRNGFPLDYVQRQPGFVCRVSGAPASDPCQNTPPADAYWGLWWSDGKSGSWSYSSEGAGSLSVPDGGYVAFSWNGSSTKSPPGAAPRPHPSSSPSPTSGSAPGGGGQSQSGSSGGSVRRHVRRRPEWYVDRAERHRDPDGAGGGPDGTGPGVRPALEARPDR